MADGNQATTPAPSPDPGPLAQFSTSQAAPAPAEVAPVDQSSPIFIGVQKAQQTPEEAVGDFLKFGVPSAALGFADTVYTSFGGNSDAVANFAKSVVPQLGDYYTNNKEAAQTVGDLLGMFIPATYGAKLLESGSIVERAVSAVGGSKIPYLSNIFTSGKDLQTLLDGLSQRALLTGIEAGNRNIAGTSIFQLEKSGVYRTVITDALKRSIGRELAVFGTMHSSETLFPSEMDVSEQLALNGVAALAEPGIDFVFARRQIARAVADTAEAVNFARNPYNIKNDMITFRPEDRDTGITTYSLMRDANKTRMQDAEISDDLRKNLNADNQQYNAIIKEQAQNLAQQTTLHGQKGLTSKFNMDEGHLQTILGTGKNPGALDISPTILQGSRAFEPLPPTMEGIQGRLEKASDDLEKMKGKLNDLRDQYSKNPNPELAAQVTAQNDAVNNFTKDEWGVVEPDGTLSDFSTRKPRATDGDNGITIQTIPGTATEDKLYMVKNINDDIFGAKNTQVGVTENFDILIKQPPQAEDVANLLAKLSTTQLSQDVEKVVSRTNFLQRVTPADLQRPEFMTHTLYDLAQVYHFSKGQLGKPIFDALPSVIQNQLRNWTGDSASSALRGWYKQGDPNAQILYSAYDNFRKRLHELADPHDGTILLFRGQSKAETQDMLQGKGNDVVSMTSSHQIAKGFGSGPGKEVIAVRVPVEDVIMPIGGLGDEFEYIVKNHTRRVVGDVVGPKQFQKTAGLNLAQILNLGTSPVQASNFTKASFGERSAAMMGMQRAIEKWDPNKNKLILSHNQGWWKYDAALELIDRHGPDIIGRGVQVPEEAQGDPINWLRWKSLQGKFTEFNDYMDYTQALADSKIAGATSQHSFSTADLQYMLNLPGTVTGQTSPVMRMFGHMRQQGFRQLQDGVASLGDFSRLIQMDMQADKQISNIAQMTSKPILPELQGRNFKYPTGAKPFVAIKAPLRADDFTRDALEIKQATGFATQIQGLLQADKFGGGMVAKIANLLNSLPDTAIARKVDSLMEGMLPGRQIIGQATWNARWAPALKAADNEAAISDRVMKTEIASYYDASIDGTPENSISNVFNRLLAPANRAHLDNWNMFRQSRLFGWDLENDEKDLQNGLTGFVLKDTKANRMRMQRFFPEFEWGPEQEVLMPNMSNIQQYQPLALTEHAFNGALAMRQLGKIVLDNNNSLARALGRAEINYKEWWVPPRDLSNKKVAYIMEGNGVKTVVSGNSQQEIDDLVKAELSANRAATAYKGLEREAYQPLVVDQQAIEKHFDVQDQVFSGMINYVDSLAQTGKSYGRTGLRTLEVGNVPLRDSISAINNQFFSIGRRTRAAFFSPEINRARLYHATSNFESKVGMESSIWQFYANTIYGKQALNEETAVGAFVADVKIFDQILAAAYESPMFRQVRYAREHRGAPAGFKGLNEQLAQFNPFSSTTDYMERTYKVSAPPTIRSLAAKFNNITSALSLRMFDAGTGLMNGLSLAATMPAVIKGLQKLPGESDLQHMDRIGAWGTKIGPGAIFNPGKVMARTAWRLFQPEGIGVINKADKMGLIDQDVAEMIRTLVAPQQGWHAQMARRAVDTVSVMADKSEKWSRAFAFLAGHDIAQDMGYESEMARFGWGNKFSDLVIGNYRPENRPQMFQGAAGMPLGLFQTFMWNYYQRMFSYIENKQLGAIATQYAMQASVFGMQTVPGWQTFVNNFATANEHSVNGVNPVDAMRRRFGDRFTDWMMYGTVSNLTGLALYTRGDVNMPKIPTLLTPENSAAWSAANQFFSLIDDTAGMFMHGGQYSNQQMMEILATHSMSRPLKGLMESLNGRSVDEHGAVINDQVRSGLEVAARMLGLRTMTEAKGREAFYRDRSGQFSQQIKFDRLDKSTRAMIRAGDWEGVNRAVFDYIRWGGDPRGIGRWLKNQSLAALVDRNERAFIHNIRNPSNLGDALRYSHMGTHIENDAEYINQEPGPSPSSPPSAPGIGAYAG